MKMHRRVAGLIAGLAAMLAPLSSTAHAQDDSHDSYRVLLFSKTAGYRHAPSISSGVAAIKQLGSEHRFAVDATEDAAAFNDANLARYQAVIWLSTTGDVLDGTQQAAFQRYIEHGGGYVGIHAAADGGYHWAWYGGLVGAYFRDHPAIQQATVRVADDDTPATKGLPHEWVRTDEWYNYRSNPAGSVRVLARLDESTYNPVGYTGGSMGADHPIVWCHPYDGGRAFYTGMGHTSASFHEPLYLRHLLGGIEMAAGVANFDCDPDQG